MSTKTDFFPQRKDISAVIDLHEPLSGGQNLIANDNLLGDVLLDIVDRQPLLDPHRLGRRLLKGVCVVISAGAKIPYIPIALRLPGGGALAFANCAAFFNLEFWAINATIDDFLGPRGEHEIVLLKRESNGKCYLVAIISTSIALALLSQVPTSLPALDYDSGAGDWGFSVLLVAGALLPIRSIQLSINRSAQMKRCVLDEVGLKIEAIRSDLVLLVNQHREFFRQSELPAKLDHLSRLGLIRDGDSVDKVDVYVRMILEESSQVEVQPPTLCDRVTSFVGLWLTSSFQVALTMYTWAKTKEHMVDDDIVAGAFATGVLVSSVYLTGKSIIQTTHWLARTVGNLLTCKKDRTIAEQVQPELCLSLKLIGLLVNLVALGPTIVIWGDFYQDNPHTQAYFVSTLSASLFLLLSTATLDSVDMAVEEIVLSGKNLSKKEIVEYHHEVQRVAQILEKSPLLDFSVFVMDCPPNIKTQMLEGVELSLEALERFIEGARGRLELTSRV